MTDNFPEAKSAADRIALKAAELLDRDIYGPVTKNHVTIRGARIYIGGGRDALYIATGDSSATHYDCAVPGSAFRDIVWQAWCDSIVRKKEKLLAPVAANIEDDSYEERQANWREGQQRLNAERDKRFRRRERLGYGAAGLAGLVLLAGIGWFIFQDVQNHAAREEAREADLNQVNAYGFRKGDLNPHLEYPADCGNYNSRRGLGPCKVDMDRWEREGQAWIDWPSEDAAP